MLIKKKNLSNKYPATDYESQSINASQDFNYQEINFKPVQIAPPITNGNHSLTANDEEKIQKLINTRKQELLEALELEITQKKQNVLAEIQSMIDTANNQAQEIINEANQQAQELEEDLNTQQDIFQKDKNDFLKQIEIEKQQAFEHGMQEARVYFDEFNRYLAEFHNMEKNARLEALPQITSIALDVARQILHYEAQTNSKLLEQQVLRSIEKVINSKGVIQIYLNPSEIQSASSLEKALTRLLDQNTRVVFLEDPGVDLGSCIINTQGGRLNASFRAQLEVINSSFEKYLGHSIDDSILDIPEPEIHPDPEPEMELVETQKPNKKSSTKKTSSTKKKSKIKSLEEPSDEDLELIENEPLDLDFEDDLAELLDDLMSGIENDAIDPNQDKSKNLSKNQELGFNNNDKDLLMEDQMAKFLDDEFEDNEDLEEDEEEDTFEFEDDLDEEEDDEDDLDDLEEFGEDDFADEEEEEDEEDPRYPEY